jgi:hypothetical protein
MLEAQNRSATKEKETPVALLVAVIAVLLFGGFAAWRLTRPVSVEPDSPATPEAKAYVRNLGLADVEMKASESFADRRVIEILGKITNKGDRPVKEVALTCIFSDVAGQFVHREKSALVRAKEGPLRPGEVRSFRLPFDTIPNTWNQALPQMVIAQVLFDQ